MPSPAFTLSVPSDASFRVLAGECVRAYFAATSPGVDVSDFVSRVAQAVERLAERGTDVEVELLAGPSDVVVHVRCSSGHEMLTHLAPAGGH